MLYSTPYAAVGFWPGQCSLTSHTLSRRQKAPVRGGPRYRAHPLVHYPSQQRPKPHPRLSNVFMLFRWAAFATAQKITSQQSPHHSRPRSLLELPLESEKRVWRNKTAIEKQQHAECYPNYRLSVNRVTNGSGTMSAGCETPRGTRGTGNVWKARRAVGKRSQAD